MPDNRVHHRRKHSYSTLSNRTKNVRTPGGRLVAQYIKKSTKARHCGNCKVRELQGVPRVVAADTPQHKRTVNRAYGGSVCAGCVKEKVVRAFLIEEQKIVKKVLKAQQNTAPKK
eukprot:TRINITY_DN4507_c0_g1_i1.p2 TRINITY_DN4507_c0_g1~~TRINITY_DN4507_c0_g1_i1.p2  ORF type:complete len:115 (-),score=32.08 TRINITY_DN4507_c0_g1_i1:53-397(-)